MPEKLCRIEITGEAILALLNIDKNVDVKKVYVNQNEYVVGLVLKGDSFPEVEEGEIIPLANVEYIPAKSIIRLL
ncbi:hypothetical protein HPT25_23500 [Bacillus sp. BRMEA1]|uniref:hypothetical protein n=1 Tax=Neobacillus endophyticus TaxID=2738405 RepID=UPI001566A1CD|nr:hypothetical protein [Neobacillus endophyticus]NRD80292.1 hypothetical protein [Neobacillus endophyticus]